MLNKLTFVVCATTLFCANQWPNASAAHLKGHGHHHDNHHKGLSKDNALYYLYHISNPGNIGAVCVSHHRANEVKPERYSIAFFDPFGDMLEGGRFCGQHTGFDFGHIRQLATKPADWVEVYVDDQSRCLLHKREELDGKSLVAKVWCEG